MIAYGTEIKSDITLSINPSNSTETKYSIEFSSKLPHELKNAISCGFSLYWTHNRYVYLYSDREFNGNEIGQPWCYEVKDVLRIYWISGEKIIYYQLDKDANRHLVSFWFIHMLLPLYMTLENMYNFIHAGSIEIDGRAVLFIAPSMGGKSTLIDYFIKQGHTLISDDKVPTFIENNRFMAVGSYPYHRPFRELEVFGYRVKNFSSQFKPIHALYLLEKSSSSTDINIDEITGFNKLNFVLPNYLYSLSYFKPKQLKYLSKMLNNTRVFMVKRPWDLNRMGDVYNAISTHSREMK